MDTHMNTHLGPPHDLEAPSMATLLVPLDGTDFSRKILDQVRTLFAPDRFRVALLHVAQRPTYYQLPYQPGAVGPDYTLYAYDSGGEPFRETDRAAYQPPAPYTGAVDDEHRGRLERELERELSVFRNEGYEATATVHFGDPVAEILAAARDPSIAAIAMATHGRTGLGRLFQGSVAQDVLKRLDRPVPVLLLRPSDKSAHQNDGPESARARLGHLDGIGSLTVRRDSEDRLIDATGTFSPNDPAADLTPLRQAQLENLAVTYDGPINDLRDQRERTRQTRVFITRIRNHVDHDADTTQSNALWIDFVAGEVDDGELVTQRSSIRRTGRA